MTVQNSNKLPSVLSVMGFDGRGRIILEAGFDHGIEVGLVVPAHELLASARFHELEPRDQETVRKLQLIQTAHHEAAHWVVAEHFGHYTGAVTIEPSNHFYGWASTEEAWCNGQRDREVGLVYLAGLAGSRLVAPDSSEHHGCQNDYENARRLLGSDLAMAEQEVTNLVTERRAAVIALAEALMSEKTLSADEAGIVISAAEEGEDWRNLLQQLRQLEAMATCNDSQTP